MTDHEMQSQGLVAQMDRLFCDLKTDEEKAAFFLSGRGYESGVIAHSIQNDVAMAYHRCSEYRKELEALQAECEELRKYAERYRWLRSVPSGPEAQRIVNNTPEGMDTAIDAAMAGGEA